MQQVQSEFRGRLEKGTSMHFVRFKNVLSFLIFLDPSIWTWIIISSRQVSLSLSLEMWKSRVSVFGFEAFFFFLQLTCIGSGNGITWAHTLYLVFILGGMANVFASTTSWSQSFYYNLHCSMSRNPPNCMSIAQNVGTKTSTGTYSHVERSPLRLRDLKKISTPWPSGNDGTTVCITSWRTEHDADNLNAFYWTTSQASI